MAKGGTEKKARKKRVLPVCGGTIGHRPLRGRCPKTTLESYNLSTDFHVIEKMPATEWKNGIRTKKYRKIKTRLPKERPRNDRNKTKDRKNI